MGESARCCHNCGSDVGCESGNDGYHYCLTCGVQSQDLIDTALAADDDAFDDGPGAGGHGIYSLKYTRETHDIKTEPQTQPLTPFMETLTRDDQEITPTLQKPHTSADEFSVPADFPNVHRPSFSAETVACEVRIRYVIGIQLTIQMQCEALVEKFGVSPVICGLAGTIWSRFVAASRVFDEAWASETMCESEVAFQERASKKEEKKICNQRAAKDGEHRNLHGEKAVLIWLRSLKRKIPVASSIAISFLACHIAREAILPIDILEWALEGKLPYIASFVDIGKLLGSSMACPLSSRFMFKPSRGVGTRQFESRAASVAQQIGLHLPPVNFYAIACRFLKQLSLPVEKILRCALGIYEWSMPPDLWLSTNPFRLPTRVCVMSIIIVAIRVLYNIHGFGIWERSLSSFRGFSSLCDQVVHPNHEPNNSNATCKFEKKAGDSKECNPISNSSEAEMQTSPVRSSSHIQSSELDTAELLHNLATAYDKISDLPEYSKDLPTYLNYCKDVIFAGITTSPDEEIIMEQLWNFYENRKDVNVPKKAEMACRKRSRDKRHSDVSEDDKNARWTQADECSSSPKQQYPTPLGSPRHESISADSALRRLKLDMEENGFHYISPKAYSRKNKGYVHYSRRDVGGSLGFVAHADYYILLRTCAKLVQVDVQTMHHGVLKLERRLSWVEERIDESLSKKPEISSKFSDTENMDFDDSPAFNFTI